jgi:regulatory protein
VTPDPLKAAALRLLARREHSREELRHKLGRRLTDEGHEDGLEDGREDGQARIERLLDELAARGLQSDERLAESVLASQARRFGPRRIEQTLRRKGVAPVLLAQSVASAGEGEFERAAALWRQRFASSIQAQPDPTARRREAARQLRFLIGRGFGSEVAHRVLRQQGGLDEAATD